MINQAPTLRLGPSPSDRFVADARRRTLRRQLVQYLPEAVADALLSGNAAEVEVAPEHYAAVVKLMSEVSRFVRTGL